MPQWLYTLLMSMVPIVELRGAIPIAIGTGVDPVLAYFMAVIGNMIPVPFILFFVVWFLGVMKRCPWNWVRKVALWIENKAQKGAAKLKHGAYIGLFLFVAIPLPMTGAWTGSLIAAFFGFKKHWSILSVFLGVLVAGVIMTLASLGVAGIFNVFAPAEGAPETAAALRALFG